MTAPPPRPVSLDRQLRLPFEGPGTRGPQSGVLEPPHDDPGKFPVRRPDQSASVAPAHPTAPVDLPVQFVRHPRARRYVLRVQPDGVVRVTIPRAGSRREGEAFLQRSRAWVDRQRAGLVGAGVAGPIDHGDVVLLDGVPTPVEVTRTGERLTVAVGPFVATGRAPTTVRELVVRALRSHAAHDLPPRTRALAAAHSLAPGRVTVRDQKGRWGSCSPAGAISLNWRLVQMPADVRDYVLLHELMHMREPNHSRRFWQHVARVCPWHIEARRWLARRGRTLL